MPRPRGRYFEEFESGERISSAGRTVTEADIVAYAGLSGDYNQIHTDAEYSKNTPVGQRVAHGLLGLSIASGLAVQTGILEGTIITFREVNEWRFLNPIFIGDTVRVEMEVMEKKSLRRIGGGLVEIKLEVINQQSEVVQRGTWTVLVASKSE
jgi:acyl dehydratase